MKRLVMLDSFADAEGNAVPASQYGLDETFPTEMVLDLQLEDASSDDQPRTKLTLRHSPTLGLNENVFAEMETGWNEFFDKLEEILREPFGR